MEVHFYFTTTAQNHKCLAVGRLFSAPDPALLNVSYNTYKSVRRLDRILVVNIKSIESVVAVIPDKHRTGSFFLAERPGLEISGWADTVPNSELDS
jgi:hypothetical protein